MVQRGYLCSTPVPRWPEIIHYSASSTSRCASRGRLMNTHSGSNKSINVIKETGKLIFPPPPPTTATASQQVRGVDGHTASGGAADSKGTRNMFPDCLSAFQRGCVFHNAAVLQGPYISAPQPVRYRLSPAMQIGNMFAAEGNVRL